MTDQAITPEVVMQKVSTGKPYVLLHLLAGKPLPEDAAIVQQLQMEHLIYMFTLEQQGHACVFGPVNNNENLHGIIIFKTLDKAMIDELMTKDPYIKKGYLKYALFDFFTIPGQTVI
jgi:uncharacterized protein YciI